MCIGIPLRVIEAHACHALCDDGGRPRRVDTTLVGPVAAGDWLLVFLDSAREVLDEADARLRRDALAALAAVMAGGPADERLFADLAGREPRLPPHLRPDNEEEKP